MHSNVEALNQVKTGAHDSGGRGVIRAGEPILIVTSFSRAPGGVTSYTKTFMDYCKRNSVRCEWVSIENFPNIRRSLVPVNLIGQFFGNLLGVDPLALSWVCRVVTLVLGLRLVIGLRRRNYGRIVAMDVAASWAAKPDVLIVHGAMADEAARQVSPGFAFRFGCILESNGYGRARKVVAVDPALKSRIIRFHRSEVNMIPNPVDLEHFVIRDRDQAKLQLGFSTRRKLIAFIGHLPEKYVEEIPRWRSEAERLGFATIHVRGISYDLMPLYLNAADLIISMSRVVAYMRVAIESLACGTPVISNNSPLASYSSPEQLINQIRAFRWPKSRQALRKKVLPFDANVICRKLLNFITADTRENN